MVDITKYTSLISSEHSARPKFMALVTGVAQFFVDLQNLMASMPGLFDLDVAVGQQLDVVGQWVGVSRILEIPLTGVFFSLDTDGVGFDQGTWKGPFDPTDQLTSLGDEPYRQLIRAEIIANNCDGTAPGAYAAYDKLLEGTGAKVFIFDNVDMSIAIGIMGDPDPVTLALITTGILPLKPGTVRIDGYYEPSVTDTPFFGFDAESDAISGFDTGSWAAVVLPPQ